MSDDRAILQITNTGHPLTTDVRLGDIPLTTVLTIDLTASLYGPVVTAVVRMLAQADVYATYDMQEACGEWALLQLLFPQIGPLPRQTVALPQIHISTWGAGGTHATALTQVSRPDGTPLRWVTVESCHLDRQTVHAKLRYPLDWPPDTAPTIIEQYAEELRALIQGMPAPETP